MATPGLKVQEVDVAAERKRRRLKLTAITVAAVVLLAAVGATAWYLTPPAMPETMQQATALVNSARFDRLSKKQKQPYYDVIREQFGSLDREERRELMKNDEAARDAMRDAWGSKMDEFSQQFLLSTPEERPALFANAMAGRRGGGERPKRPEGDDKNAERPQRPEGGDRDNADRKRERGERINDRMTNGNAQTNQAMGEMFIQFRKEREKQGQTR